MYFYADWNFWLSVITAGIAILAIFQTRWQIKLSNKQQLYEKRVASYEKIDSILQLWDKAKDLFASVENSPIRTIEYKFSYMTNNSYLENVYSAIKKPMESPYHEEFLKKMEEIRQGALSFSLLFSGMEAGYAESFLYKYQELLIELYRYKKILLDIEEELGRSGEYDSKFRKEIEESYDESKWRNQILLRTNDLNKVYDQIRTFDAEKKLKKQISLIC